MNVPDDAPISLLGVIGAEPAEGFKSGAGLGLGGAAATPEEKTENRQDGAHHKLGPGGLAYGVGHEEDIQDHGADDGQEASDTRQHNKTIVPV